MARTILMVSRLFPSWDLAYLYIIALALFPIYTLTGIAYGMVELSKLIHYFS